jgi:hypothetical protein
MYKMSIKNPFGPSRHIEKQPQEQGVPEEEIRRRAEKIFQNRAYSPLQYEEVKKEIELLAKGDNEMLKIIGQYYLGWTGKNFERLLEVLEELERGSK